MGEAGRYFVFESKTRSILKLEESQVIPYGVYQMKVTIAAKNQKSYSYSVIFLVSQPAK